MAEKVTAGPITSANGVREAVCAACNPKDLLVLQG